MSLAGMVAERRGMLLRDLASLTIEAVCIEIGEVLWQQALTTARFVYGLPVKDRGKAHWRLRCAENLTDRHAARLIDQWIDDDRQRGKP
jgi:hypothetical protein